MSRLTAGDNPLDDVQAHHARNVLRLGDGAIVEAFDDAGNTAAATLRFAADGTARLVVAGDVVRGVPCGAVTIASAVPKGDRADWMVEKLSELGVREWVPLAAERSVVLPEGKGKHDRWVRIATEAAKQSQRVGVMRVGSLTKLPALLASRSGGAPPPRAWCLATEGRESLYAGALATQLSPADELTVFVGPEGGWTPGELDAFTAAGVPLVRLTPTVLRVETAAVAVAAVLAAAFAARP